MSTSVSAPVTRTVEMGGMKVAVTKLPVGRWIDIVEKLDNLPSIALSAASTQSGIDDVAKLMLAAISLAKDEFFDIVSTASGLDKETILNEVALDELVEYVEALIEINRVQWVVGKIWAAVRSKFRAA